ncbi:MAG: hypothetical protein II202_03935, partial [Bacteroidales bacterium]|nr:hypothetical protein [Bacteroidales bacterium]
MKIIAITSPKVTDADEYIIKGLVKRGIDIVHFRKPDSGIEECRSLLLKLTSGERSKIVVHDYPSLYEEFSLLGIHVNKNVTSLPEGYSGLKTRSCHSFEEVENNWWGTGNSGRFVAAMVAFIFNYACYFSEIFRGG